MPRRDRALRRRVAALAILAALVVVAALIGWFLTQPQKHAAFALNESSFYELDGWSSADARPALDAFRRSCASMLALPSNHPMSGEGYGGASGDWAVVCRAVPAHFDTAGARRWFEANFVPFAVTQGTSDMGIFTGYYEPELRGSRKLHGAFRWPVYGVPPDLIEVDLGIFRVSLRGETIVGRILRHTLVPYPTRAEIDHDGLPGTLVLFYTDDPAELFFLQIQGSGRVRFDNGMIERVAYAAQNGWPYTPIGRVLVDEGKIPRQRLSMQRIRAWMDAHPGDARALMEKDESYVFFKELPLGDPSLGSPGAEGVPLTPGASLAVDSRVHPLGAPIYVVAQQPDESGGEQVLQQLFVAQDIGGAIRGAVRGDVFFGYGARAENRAGVMKSNGRMFVLLPKGLAARVAGARS